MELMENKRLAWLKSIYPNFIHEDWHENRVLYPSLDVPNYKFYQEPIYYCEEIDSSQIVGIEYFGLYNHPWNDHSPVEFTWMDLFQNLKRLGDCFSFKTLEEVINHIHNDYQEPKTVMKFGDQYYTTIGQHRLCLAKLLKLEKVKVHVLEYQFDQQLFVIHKTIEKYFSILKTHKLVSYRKSDQNYLCGVEIELNKKKFTIPVEFIKSFIDIYDNTSISCKFSFTDRLKSSIVIYIGNHDINIKAVSDLQKLKPYIILHKFRTRMQVK